MSIIEPLSRAFHGHNIRIVTRDNNPWFVANDLAGALGFTRDNLKYHMRNNVAADERGVVRLPTIRGPQSVAILSESALYKLALRSDKKSAVPFQDWVTREVLPAIRKDGAYVLGEEKVKTGELFPAPLPNNPHTGLIRTASESTGHSTHNPINAHLDDLPSGRAHTRARLRNILDQSTSPRPSAAGTFSAGPADR